MMNCKYCGARLKKESWTRKKDSWQGEIRYPAGTYEYYECSNCGMRYTPQEVKSEAAKV